MVIIAGMGTVIMVSTVVDMPIVRAMAMVTPIAPAMVVGTDMDIAAITVATVMVAVSTAAMVAGDSF